jgi:hypothetical protein
MRSCHSYRRSDKPECFQSPDLTISKALWVSRHMHMSTPARLCLSEHMSLNICLSVTNERPVKFCRFPKFPTLSQAGRMYVPSRRHSPELESLLHSMQLLWGCVPVNRCCPIIHQEFVCQVMSSVKDLPGAIGTISATVVATDVHGPVQATFDSQNSCLCGLHICLGSSCLHLAW